MGDGVIISFGIIIVYYFVFLAIVLEYFWEVEEEVKEYEYGEGEDKKFKDVV